MNDIRTIEDLGWTYDENELSEDEIVFYKPDDNINSDGEIWLVIKGHCTCSRED